MIAEKHTVCVFPLPLEKSYVCAVKVSQTAFEALNIQNGRLISSRFPLTAWSISKVCKGETALKTMNWTNRDKLTVSRTFILGSASALRLRIRDKKAFIYEAWMDVKIQINSGLHQKVTFPVHRTTLLTQHNRLMFCFLWWASSIVW